MSASLRDQFWLPFGDEQHFELLHGRHSADVAICLEPSPGDWREQTFEHDHAGELAAKYSRQHAHNVYQSQNGFEGWREVAKLSALTSCWVDLDTYKLPVLAGVDGYGLIDRMREIAPWLPTPTALVSSGRGYYFSWVFRKPLAAKDLPRWQWVQNVIVDALAPLGADPKCREPARVLRIDGTVNSKNGAMVRGWMQTGAALTFAALDKAATRGACLAQEARANAVAKDHAQTKARRELTPEECKRGYEGLAKQNQNRIADCHTLALLRGSPAMADCRHRLLHAYAVFGAWFWSSPEQAERELIQFARQHFKDGHKYGPKRVRSVLRRWEEELAKVSHTWLNPFTGKLQKGSRRYKFKTPTVIRDLEISAEEQRHMLALVSPEEKARRKTQKRRDAGMEPMEARHSRKLQRITDAHRMRLEGRTQAEIAKALGVSQPAVSGYLRTGL